MMSACVATSQSSKLSGTLGGLIPNRTHAFQIVNKPVLYSGQFIVPTFPASQLKKTLAPQRSYLHRGYSLPSPTLARDDVRGP